MSARRIAFGPGGAAWGPPGKGRSKLLPFAEKCTFLLLPAIVNVSPCCAGGSFDPALSAVSSATRTDSLATAYFSCPGGDGAALKEIDISGSAAILGGSGSLMKCS